MVLNRPLCWRTPALLMLSSTIFAALVGCLTDTTATESSAVAPDTSSTRSESATSESRSPAAPVAPARIDIARLVEVSGDFPAEFPPGPPRGPTKESPEYAHLVGDTVSYGRPFTVDPPQCRGLLDPVDGQAGADRMLVGAQGPGKQVISVIVSNPVAVRAGLPSTGCERMSFHVEDDAVLTLGTAERLAAPNIDGAATSAHQSHYRRI